MYNPQYTTRFAVIMEAYLKACGKSMLVGYYTVEGTSRTVRRYNDYVAFFSDQIYRSGQNTSNFGDHWETGEVVMMK